MELLLTRRAPTALRLSEGKLLVAEERDIVAFMPWDSCKIVNIFEETSRGYTTSCVSVDRMSIQRRP
jgi:hypothetical protein